MTGNETDNVDPGWIDRCRACGLEMWMHGPDVAETLTCPHCDAVNRWVACALCRGRGETSWSYVRFEVETWGWETCSACGGHGQRRVVREGE